MAEKDLREMTHSELLSHTMAREGVFAKANAELREKSVKAVAETVHEKKKAEQYLNASESWKAEVGRLNKELAVAQEKIFQLRGERQVIQNQMMEAKGEALHATRKANKHTTLLNNLRVEMDRRVSELQADLELEKKGRAKYVQVITDTAEELIRTAGFTPDQVEEWDLTGAVRQLALRRGVVTEEAVVAAHTVAGWLATTHSMVRNMLQEALPHMIVPLPEMPDEAVSAEMFSEAVGEVDRLENWLAANLDTDFIADRTPVDAAIAVMTYTKRSIRDVVQLFFPTDSVVAIGGTPLLVGQVTIGPEYEILNNQVVRKQDKHLQVWAVTKGETLYDMVLAGVYASKGDAQGHANHLNNKDRTEHWTARAWVLRGTDEEPVSDPT